MIKNKKIEIWKFEEFLPSSLYHLTSKYSSFFPLPSSYIEVLFLLPSYIFHHKSFVFKKMIINFTLLNKNPYLCHSQKGKFDFTHSLIVVKNI